MNISTLLLTIRPRIKWRPELSLLVILCLALALRLVCLQTKSLIIENEGAEYASIAENLLAGNGYVGQGLTGKPQLFFPPLYPLTIAALAIVTQSTETAGRIISLVMGLGLVVALYRLGSHFYGRTVGLLAATLAAIHPLLIQSSVQVQTEAMYFTFIVLGAYYTIKAVESHAVRYFLLAGALYGCAYLTRPEALLLLLASASFALLVAAFDRTRRSVPFLGIAGMIALFLLFASPYVLYLYRQTGVVRFEAKSNLNWVIGTKMLSGLSEAEANYGVTDGLEEEGVYLGKINEHIAGAKRSANEVLFYVVASAKNQARNLYKGLIQMAWFGGPFFLCLIVLGLLRRTWDRTRLIRECYLFFILATIVTALLSLQYFQARYLFATLPFLIVWAAKGIDELQSWVTATREAAFGRSRLATGLARLCTCGLAMGGLFALAFQQTAFLDDFGGSKESIANAKQAGLWLREQGPADKSVMDAGSAIPYYSNAEYLYLPHSSSSTALRYIKEKRPDYIVLRGILRGLRPYVSDWMQSGIPDGNAVLVYSAGESLPDMVQIYKWKAGKEEIAGGVPQGNLGNVGLDSHKGTASR